MDVQHVRRIAKVSPLVELVAETSISGVFLELVTKSLISFLQFSILKRVITELCTGSQELQEKLKAYESEFNDYIRRRVCETSIYHEGRFEVFTGSQSDKKVELTIITDEYWDDSIGFVKVLDLEALVAKCLNIDRFNLQMFRIEPNCLRIRYAVSIHIAKTVFPLTNEEWKQLCHLGIVKIHCPEYFYTTDDKVGALPFKTNDQFTSIDHLIQFGEGLGMEVGELEKLWDKVLGRYHRAVQSLVVGILQESQYAVEKLVHAISHMRTPESAKTAALAVQKVVLMVECLTVLFKDVKDILLLGQLLRMPEETLAAIDSYYEEDCHKMSHMLSLWLMEDHEDPVTPLRDALNSLGKEEVSQTLVLLTSLVTNTLSASVDIKADDFPWKGHLMTLSNLMRVFKKVIYLDRVSNAFGMSPEAMSGDEEERLGKVSNFFLEKKLTWKHLRKLLIRHNEMQAVQFVDLMEQYVREDAPLTAVLAHEVLKKVEILGNFASTYALPEGKLL
ncbi:hypothetical protein GBAR_LOCUS19121 [Geodia barretti]|uniref:Uncharacterized protein n=2 Tax=Geodia barretti TaxID=519541 RepID=A0AA35SPM1_GEOBA|nr:hypothetical protein GBAR_LOCUS19121 [Geodia barretti]